MLPLRVSNPLLVLIRLPLPFSAPLNVPLLNVSAVPFNATVPLPKRVCTATDVFERFTRPFAVIALVAGNADPLSLVKVAPEATDSTVLASVPDNVKVPALTVVIPLYPLLPLNVSNPALTLIRLPVAFNAPLKLPLLNVSAVPFNVTAPEPSNVCTVTDVLERLTKPSAVKVLAVGNKEPLGLLNVAAEATLSTVLASVPANVSVPSFTEVEPK